MASELSGSETIHTTQVVQTPNTILIQIMRTHPKRIIPENPIPKSSKDNISIELLIRDKNFQEFCDCEVSTNIKSHHIHSDSPVF